MDPITHGLTGWLIARAVPSEKGGREATAAVVLGSVFPDIDHMGVLLGSDFHLRIHRGLSHSFFGIAVSSLLLAFLFYRYGRWKDFRRLYLLILLGQLSHVALDLLNSYGTQIFQPFSDARVSLDLLFVLDFLFTGIVAGGIALSRRGRAVMARAAFLVLAAYVGFAALLHMRAETVVQEAAARGGVRVVSAWAIPVTEKVPAAWLSSLSITGFPGFPGPIPVPVGPFAWNGFVDDGRTYLRAEVNPLTGDVSWKERVVRGWDAPEAKALLDIPEVRTYLWFARFPIVETAVLGAGTVVTFADLRYESLQGRRPFLLRVIQAPGRSPQILWGES
jgi:membrane-bound metal-dependent hydrolase YbcI (DUF457 family)